MGQNTRDISSMVDRNPNSNTGGMGMTGQRRSMSPNQKPVPMTGDHPAHVQSAGAGLKAPKF